MGVRRWDYDRATSNEVDVLHPFFNHVYGNLLYYPYEKKTNKALMRAALQVRGHVGGSRNCITSTYGATPAKACWLAPWVYAEYPPAYTGHQGVP